MKIKRNWLITGWPAGRGPCYIVDSALFYLLSGEVEIIVREFHQIMPEYYEYPEEISEEISGYDYSKNRLMIKVPGDSSREEYEFKIDRYETEKLRKMVNKYPIHEHTVICEEGRHKVCLSNVDGIWCYAEVEFNSEDEAASYEFPFPDRIIREIKDLDKYMKDYWHKTRGK